MENTAETVATPQAQAQETSPAPEAPKVEEKVSSSKLLDLAKKEAEFAKREVSRKEEITKLQEQLKSYESEVGYFRKAKETYRDNPEALLTKLGITYDELTDAVLDYYDNKEKGAKPLDADAIRKEIENEFRKQEAAKAEAVAKQAVENFGKEITQFVKENEEKFPHLTRLSKPLGETDTPEEFIFSIVENYYNETGELLGLEAAATSAEEYFREEWDKLNGVLTKRGEAPKVDEKVKTEKKLDAPQAPKSEGDIKPVNATTFVKKELANPTITNNFAKPVTRVPYRDDKVSRRDVIDKAVAAMEAAQRRPR